MEDFVKDDLEKEEQSDFHKQMLKDCRALVDMSRKKMSNYYDTWDRHNEIYRGERRLDQQDKKAIERKEPEKMVVPISYAQTQTFVGFCFSLYTQRERLFELVGMSEEDHKAARVGEALLARDLSYNCFEKILYQFLLDLTRFGLGIIKSTWVKETQRVRQTIQPDPWTFLGLTLKRQPQEVETITTKFLGNKLVSISPYRFFPDTRLPISRFQEGEFCASEDEYAFTTLKQMEKDGLIAGTKYVPNMTKEGLERRGTTHTSMDFSIRAGSEYLSEAQSKGMVILTEVQRTIIPKDYEINGNPLGKEDYPVKYVIVYANDSRVVKCEPLNYVHDQFTYDLSEFNPDVHNLVNPGLSDSIDKLQDVISWFINSRITSVRKVISNYLIVDPEGVEMKDLQNRNPVIRIKPTAAGRGVDRWIKQLDVNDVTTNHINDVEFLNGLIQTVTGISENLMGQFHGGRRSATEARNVQSSAAARLKMLAAIIFRTALEPMGRKMLSNLRDGLDEETTVRVVGLTDALEGASFLPVDKSSLAGAYDFEIFDGTLPSEKIHNAQALQEVLSLGFKNPEVSVALRLDLLAVFIEWLQLRGVRNPERFTLHAPDENTLALLGQQQQQMNGQSQNGAPAPATNGRNENTNPVGQPRTA